MTREELLDLAATCSSEAGLLVVATCRLLDRFARVLEHLAEQPDHAQRAASAEPAYAETRGCMSARKAARLRTPLDGADAQALEHALTITEKERDAAYARLVELEKERDLLRGSVDDYKRAMDDARSERNAERAAIDEAWKAAAVPVRGMVSLADVIADLREKRDEARAELNQLAARGAGDDAYIEGLREGIADAQAEAIAMVDLLRNLAAVIDRDGGQRQDGEHISVTAARAMETVVGMIQQLDEVERLASPHHHSCVHVSLLIAAEKERDEARAELRDAFAALEGYSEQTPAEAIVSLRSEVERLRLVAACHNAPPAEIVPPKPAEAGPVPAHTPELGPCWGWTGTTNGSGYGTILECGRRSPLLRAHRVAFFLAEGRWPEPCALHKCDNPPCVRRSNSGGAL